MKQILLYCILTMSILYAQTIRVGSENAYKPFAYLNHKSEASGFDNDVVKVVAKYMQNDKIEFVPVGWNSIFSGLDSAKFDIVANQIAKTKLYQKEEVQTYFKLQRELEEKINGDIANLYEPVIF